MFAGLLGRRENIIFPCLHDEWNYCSPYQKMCQEQKIINFLFSTASMQHTQNHQVQQVLHFNYLYGTYVIQFLILSVVMFSFFPSFMTPSLQWRKLNMMFIKGMLARAYYLVDYWIQARWLLTMRGFWFVFHWYRMLICIPSHRERIDILFFHNLPYFQLVQFASAYQT